MNIKTIAIIFISILTFSQCGNLEKNNAPIVSDPALADIKLPPGFSISIYTDQVPGARSMTLGDKGTLFVGTKDNSAVYAVVDTNNDHKADKVVKIADGLNAPNGVAFKDGALYVAEISRVIRFDSVESNLDHPLK